MFLVGMLGWWYTDGWKARRQATLQRIVGVAEFFSIGQLASTLFSPFRQISAGRVSGSVGVQLRAFFDQLLSRVIGMVIRSLFIIIAIVTITVMSVFEMALIVAWLFVPFIPIVGCIIAVTGWMPWR